MLAVLDVEVGQKQDFEPVADLRVAVDHWAVELISLMISLARK